jgi:hypothetical protein
MRKMCSAKMSDQEAADLLMTGVYVRRVGVTPADQNLYVTVRHILDLESSVIRNVVTGEERLEGWDNIEFS